MKVDLATIHKLGITPNGLYLLYCMKEGIEPCLVDVTIEIPRLQHQGFIDKSGVLTICAQEVMAKARLLSKTKGSREKLTEDAIPWVIRYRELFPRGQLPNGSPARSSVKDLKEKFEVFLTKYPEFKDWELILKATAVYLDEAEQRSFEYTHTSENFIYKQDSFKNWKSTLANYCQLVLDDGVGERSAAPSIVTIPGL